MSTNCLKFETGTRAAAAGHRTRSWLLFIAILPAITFLGHWPELTIDIPGTNAWLSIPLTGGHAHTHSHGVPTTAAPSGPNAQAPDGEDHNQHCHASASTCTDVPFTGASAFALMAEVVAFLGMAGAAILLVSGWWRPTRALRATPELPPPRAVVAAHC